MTVTPMRRSALALVAAVAGYLAHIYTLALR